MHRLMGLLFIPRQVPNPRQQILIKTEPNTKKFEVMVSNPIVPVARATVGNIGKIGRVVAGHLGAEVEQ